MINILAIGDTANNAYVLSKFVKKSKIHIINFPRLGAATQTYTDNVEFFDSFSISEQVKKVESIKDNYDLCLTTSWEGARVAYLANLNYIMYFVGGDMTSAPFIKNATVPYLKNPIHKKNFAERRFLKNILDNAVACVTWGGKKHLKELQKFRKDGIRMDTIPVDTTIFHENIKPLEKTKEKFTFLSPQRMGLEKGMNVIWDALPLCKSNFEIHQVNWFDERTQEEINLKNKFLKNKPSQIKLIPLIKRQDMPHYYAFADAVLGQMRVGGVGGIEREAVFCRIPVVLYADSEWKYLVNNEEITCPFLPDSPGPEKLAEIIDKIVEDKSFRQELLEKELDFVKKISEPIKCAEIWDKLFEDVYQKVKTINKKPSGFKKFIDNTSVFLGEKFVYKKKWEKQKGSLLEKKEK